MKYETVIGLEIHSELLTRSKVFCSCENSFGGRPNTRICPICTGMPETLPVLNQNAVKLAVKAGIALGCKINSCSAFDRKNYFYPDLPKGYQITQQEYPICENGELTIGNKSYGIERIHIEEDAGKLLHGGADGKTLVDFNRCGVPLIEIVTKPDFRSAEEVCSFVSEVCMRLKYAGVCSARLEEGSVRVDVNISVRPENTEKLGERAELKNINSFKSITRAIEYETVRQIELSERGGKVLQETRRFDEASGRTFSMRNKETANDYRYFPEPHIPPLYISERQIEAIGKEMPQMPHERYQRYTKEYGLSAEEARLIVKDKSFSDFYDKTTAIIGEYKKTANMMLGELNRFMNDSGKVLSQLRITPSLLARLIKLLSDGIITNNGAKLLLVHVCETGESPQKAAEDKGLTIHENQDELLEACKKVLAENDKNVEAYRNGKTQLFGFFMGQVIRMTGKGTNPESVKKALETLLKQI